MPNSFNLGHIYAELHYIELILTDLNVKTLLSVEFIVYNNNLDSNHHTND